MYTFDHPKRKLKGAFSIIELIVAMTIFLVLSSVMLADYNGMNSRITLDTNAHQIAQWVRQTQVSAMSVKHTGASANTFPGYGLHFDRTTPGQFVFFADLNGDHKYSPFTSPAKCGDAGEECEQIVTLPKGNIIQNLCSELAPPFIGTSINCAAPLNDANTSDIVFTRPDPDAIIGGMYSGTNYGTSSRAEIYLASAKGHKRMVEVWVTGQVSVQ